MCYSLTSITKRSLMSNWCAFTAIKVASGASEVYSEDDNCWSPIRSLRLLSLKHLMGLGLGCPLPSFSLLSSLFQSSGCSLTSCLLPMLSPSVHVHVWGHGYHENCGECTGALFWCFSLASAGKWVSWKIWLCSCSCLVLSSARQAK